MRTVNQWLEEYGESHKNETNKSIHWICVPAIFFSIVGLLYSVKLSWIIDTHTVNVAMIAISLITLYYLRLSLPLGIGMFIFGVICLFIAHCYRKVIMHHFRQLGMHRKWQIRMHDFTKTKLLFFFFKDCFSTLHSVAASG